MKYTTTIGVFLLATLGLLLLTPTSSEAQQLEEGLIGKWIWKSHPGKEAGEFVPLSDDIFDISIHVTLEFKRDRTLILSVNQLKDSRLEGKWKVLKVDHERKELTVEMSLDSTDTIKIRPGKKGTILIESPSDDMPAMALRRVKIKTQAAPPSRTESTGEGQPSDPE